MRILKDTDNSLTKQYKSLFETENIDLQFDDDAIDEIANLTERINKEVENIGARRLQTMFEKILEKLSFEANLSEKKLRSSINNGFKMPYNLKLNQQMKKVYFINNFLILSIQLQNLFGLTFKILNIKYFT